MKGRSQRGLHYKGKGMEALTMLVLFIPAEPLNLNSTNLALLVFICNRDVGVQTQC